MEQKKIILLQKWRWTRMLFTQVLLVVLMTGIASAQQKSITGKVSDQSGSLIPGASIIIKGTTTGTVTDNNGKFTLTNVSEKSTLVCSFVGMLTQEILVGNKTQFTIVLTEEAIGCRIWCSEKTESDCCCGSDIKRCFGEQTVA
jgi:hypothetical protein